MSSAYHRLSLAQRQEVRLAVRDNKLYLMLYAPLHHQRGDDLAPEDVWAEAVNVAQDLKEISAFEAPLRVSETMDDLCERYAAFEDDSGKKEQRSRTAAEHSAMMVLTTSFFMLLNVKEDLETNPNRFVCRALKDAVRAIEGFDRLYEDARQTEDSMEQARHFVQACELMDDICNLKHISQKRISRMYEVVSKLVEETLKSTTPTIREQERLLSRVNDSTGGAIEAELGRLRHALDERNADNGCSKKLTKEQLGCAIEEVQRHFWAQSSWAVVFSVCRDKYGGTDIVSQFERDVQELARTHHFSYDCPSGTISRAISNNQYLKKHADTWERLKAPRRVLGLAKALISALENTN